jgi:hypothetical protein
VSAAACGTIARLSWRRAVGGAGRGALAVTRLAVDPVDVALEQALAGAALERAVDHDYASRGPAAVRQYLDDHAAALAGKPGLDPIEGGAIRARLGEAAAAFGAAVSGGDGARALKLARDHARVLTR